MEEEIKELASIFYRNTQFSLGIIDGDDVKYFGCINTSSGVQLLENKNKIFEIGSITKIFTSYILSKFVLDEKLLLGDRISKYLSVNLEGANKITIEQLANHTSGLPRLPSNFYDHTNYLDEDPYNCLLYTSPSPRDRG